MGFRFFLLLIGSSLLYADFSDPFSGKEGAETEQRLQRALKKSDPGALFVSGGKYDPRTGQLSRRHRPLKSAASLKAQAGWKASASYQKLSCEQRRRFFPGLNCNGSRSTLEANDRVEDLAQSWLKQVEYRLDEIPGSGKTDRPIWSDDYWAMRYGLTSYRYSEGKDFNTYQEAVADYAQPLDWSSLLSLPFAKWASKIVAWSPSEKYDLTVGDTEFSLTKEQKGEGQAYLANGGDVEAWMGICHGWAPASIMVAKPMKPVTVTGANDAEVVWYPNDIKALASLHWANANWGSNFVGGRCDIKKTETFPNGRLSQQECFDTNPATFHLSLGNLIGKARGSFVMDKTFDFEVWNQPVAQYRFKYFNPLNASEKSAQWEKVAVDYDGRFKAQDRFQNPLTRGLGHGGDSHIQKIVGVMASVVYGVEVDPEHTPEPEEDMLERETYLYDLELTQEDGVWVVTGGEWYQNNHPDFLFTPKKNAVSWESYDKGVGKYDGVVTPQLLASAKQGSTKDGYPLCVVLKHLIRESTGEDSVQCLEK